ncbi:MAG: hypothetical protein RQ783_03280 [Gammaproteobacteria bacterium]|nr:hypothetical protein [Gammaproteobacteria bacterium]
MGQNWIVVDSKSGHYYYNIARAIDQRPVRSQRQCKSLGKETTFAEDIVSTATLFSTLEALAETVVNMLQSQQLKGRTLTVKVKYANFQHVTRAHTVEHQLDLPTVKHVIPLLLARTEIGHKPVRLVGLSISGFEHVNSKQQQSQLDLQLSDVF